MADRHEAPGALFQPTPGHVLRGAKIEDWAHLYPGLIGVFVRIWRHEIN